jgi:hypothetical protein
MAIPLSSPYFIAGAILFALSGIVAYFWLSSFIFGAGYQGAPRRSVEAMFRLSRLGKDDYLFELGAGIGTVTFPAAREKSARVLAVEIEPLRSAILRVRRAVGPSADRIEIRRENFFNMDLGAATVISAFLWPGAMARLRPKFESELRPGVRIVSRCHPIPTWEPTEYDRDADVYLYIWPDSAVSTRMEHVDARAPSEASLPPGSSQQVDSSSGPREAPRVSTV